MNRSTRRSPERRRNARVALLVSCEHGGNRVPAAWQALFEGADAVLASHRGWDPGSETLARALAAMLRAPCLVTRTTRLLVDANRSPGNPRLFSEYSRALSAPQRAAIVAEYHTPHHQRIASTVAGLLADHACVIHVAAHSFTPVLNGRVRTADVGLLYDPQRRGELALARHWQHALAECAPSLRVRRNYPYRGRDDGVTRWLRSLYAPPHYLGVELELNQAIAAQPAPRWAALRRTLAASLRRAIGRTLV